jgi:serine/threonine protein kinase
LAIACIVQVNSALAYLKTRNPPIFHRDIKFENLLVDANGVIKLADLGLAATHDLGQTHTQGAGTPYWLAPEVLHGREYDYPSDQYSLALVVLRVLKGVIKNDGTIDVPPSHSDPDVQEYLRHQLNVDPTKRWTAEETLLKFKGKGGTSLRGVIKLPGTRDKILSPYEITWQHTTTEERQRNDELRRLALAFTNLMDEEKDISVVVDALKVLPFDGTWTTKSGLAIQRRDGQISLPPGLLGPAAPATPFKAAYMRNLQGKESEKEDGGDDEESEGPSASRKDDEPEKRRLLFDDDSKKPNNNRRRTSKLQDIDDTVNNGRNARATSRLGARRKSDVDESEKGDSSGTDKNTSNPSKHPSAVRRRPERATTLARQRMREKEEASEPESAATDHSIPAENGESDAEEEPMTVDSAAEQDEKPSKAPRRRSRGTTSAKITAPSRRLTRSITTQLDTTPAASGPSRRSRTTLTSAAAARQSIENSLDTWQDMSIDERIDCILQSEEWYTDTSQWVKTPRIKFPESEARLKEILASLLETDLVERSWIRSVENSQFAKKLWDWVVEEHDLWRDKTTSVSGFPNKKRKRGAN